MIDQRIVPEGEVEEGKGAFSSRGWRRIFCWRVGIALVLMLTEGREGDEGDVEEVWSDDVKDADDSRDV